MTDSRHTDMGSNAVTLEMTAITGLSNAMWAPLNSKDADMSSEKSLAVGTASSIESPSSIGMTARE